MDEIEDQLKRLAAHRAAQVPAFSTSTADELVVRRRATRRTPVLVAMAALPVFVAVRPAAAQGAPVPASRILVVPFENVTRDGRMPAYTAAAGFWPATRNA